MLDKNFGIGSQRNSAQKAPNSSCKNRGEVATKAHTRHLLNLGPFDWVRSVIGNCEIERGDLCRQPLIVPGQYYAARKMRLLPVVTEPLQRSGENPRKIMLGRPDGQKRRKSNGQVSIGFCGVIRVFCDCARGG